LIGWQYFGRQLGGDWRGLKSCQNAESHVDLTRFFIASLFVYKLLWGMGTQTHTFHPSKHPKEK
jgi:hypothetical protein